jgi:hypothetical protein
LRQREASEISEVTNTFMAPTRVGFLAVGTTGMPLRYRVRSNSMVRAKHRIGELMGE